MNPIVPWMIVGCLTSHPQGSATSGEFIMEQSSPCTFVIENLKVPGSVGVIPLDPVGWICYAANKTTMDSASEESTTAHSCSIKIPFKKGEILMFEAFPFYAPGSADKTLIDVPTIEAGPRWDCKRKIAGDTITFSCKAKR